MIGSGNDGAAYNNIIEFPIFGGGERGGKGRIRANMGSHLNLDIFGNVSRNPIMFIFNRSGFQPQSIGILYASKSYDAV